MGISFAELQRVFFAGKRIKRVNFNGVEVFSEPAIVYEKIALVTLEEPILQREIAESLSGLDLDLSIQNFGNADTATLIAWIKPLLDADYLPILTGVSLTGFKGLIDYIKDYDTPAIIVTEYKQLTNYDLASYAEHNIWFAAGSAQLYYDAGLGAIEINADNDGDGIINCVSVTHTHGNEAKLSDYYAAIKDTGHTINKLATLEQINDYEQAAYMLGDLIAQYGDKIEFITIDNIGGGTIPYLVQSRQAA